MRRVAQLPIIWTVPLDYNDRSNSTAFFGKLRHRFANNRFELALSLRQFHDEVSTIVNLTLDSGVVPIQKYLPTRKMRSEMNVSRLPEIKGKRCIVRISRG